jgi:hypothetical protein
MTTARRHVIFGSGAIGPAVLDALRRRGETARLVNRSGSAPVPDDVQVAAETPGTRPSPPRSPVAPASSTRR